MGGAPRSARFPNPTWFLLGLAPALGGCPSGPDSGDVEETENAAPVLENLPFEVEAFVNAAGAYTVEASDPDGDPLAFAISDSNCPFSPSIGAETGHVAFTCGGEPRACEATVAVTDDGQPPRADYGSLGIRCVSESPVFTSVPPTAAQEFAEYRYAIACADPNGDSVALARTTADTCGGSVADGGDGTGTYAFTPGEAEGGTSCTVALACRAGTDEATQSRTVSIAETNAAPRLANLPDTIAVHAGQAGAFVALATDSDLPANALTFSLDTATCAFGVTVAPGGAVSWICASVGDCKASVRVSDDGTPALADAEDLTLECTNAAPAFASVPPTDASEFAEFAYDAACTDADGDPLALAVAPSDTCGGEVADQGDGHGTYAFVPTGIDLWSTCRLAIGCSDGHETAEQTATVSIEPWGSCWLTEADDAACSDGVDNDVDRTTDCEDLSCIGSPYVTVCGPQENTNEACSDGIDNDGDPYVDCAEVTCSRSLWVTVCPDTEHDDATCQDGADNDHDGNTDCTDLFSCARNPNVTVCGDTCAK